jgi:phosphatidylglycerophosphate synthase
VADTLSLARMVLAVAVAWCGLADQGRLALAALVTAAVTDILDGRFARRRGATRFGLHLDAAADTTLLAATAAALLVLHPAILDLAVLLLAAGLVYATGATAGWLATRRLVDPAQLTAKLAGGALYAFALLTLATGDYEPGLLTIAVAALGVASVETILKAIRIIHVSWTASRHRSHAPQEEKLVASSAAAATSIATSTAPRPVETRP